MTTVEPERELVRRVLPFVPVAVLVAFAVGWVLGGSGAAWAAKVSPTMLAIVALGGYLVRLIIFTMVLVGLNTLAWFSPLAFALALMPATIALLVYEAKLLSGRLQADLWSFEGARP